MKHSSRINNQNPTLVYLGSDDNFDFYVDLKWDQLLIVHGDEDTDYRATSLDEAKKLRTYDEAYHKYVMFIIKVKDHIK